MTKALIIVDVQNDFISGSLPVPGGEGVAQRIAYQLLPHYEGYAVTTQDWHVEPGDHFTEWPRHCVAGTEGAGLHDDLKGIHFDARFHKGQFSASYSGFDAEWHDGRRECLEAWLRAREVTEVAIVGLALDHCVKATALDAVKKGFATTMHLAFTAAVDENRIVSVITELQEAGVKVVQAATL